MTILTVFFYISLFVVFYAYFGYPLSLLVLRKFSRKKQKRERITATVTLIITAFNEERRIREKLENSLLFDYPLERLQIMVASDGSTDQTNKIVRSYADKGIELLEVRNRGGKENAQKEAVSHARGEIIVFSDVATILEPQGLMEIVSNFADPSVGCVSSEDRLLGQDGKPSGEGFYVRYEMWLRHLESQVNSLVGLSGSFFAARKEVCQDFSGDVQSDFRTLLSSMKHGLRGVSDPKAVGYYLDIADEKREFERKVRTVLRGLTVFFSHLEFLNAFKYKVFTYQLFCHKLMRWLVPFFLVGAFMSNVLLISSSNLFVILLVGQSLFYGLALFNWSTGSLQGVLKIPMFFLVVNTAIAVAWWHYLTGKRVILWTPSER
ncbi:MAG: glycosyltransferase family 2 protein [Candidatus Electrothrix sp. GM3_4]|nr:glycosyltransferase family 2 protein [Candidatus Electrothrix sp. GM3_4]